MDLTTNQGPIRTGRTPSSLPRVLYEHLVRSALLEDLGRAGDITTDSIVPTDLLAEGTIVAREAGIVAGADVAASAFQLLDPNIFLEICVADGIMVSPGDVVVRVSGNARTLLTAERTALNFLCRLSGIATATARLVEAVQGCSTVVSCTRKTTPGLRALEKAAVRAGGGLNHRFGLDDAVLIKDNHIALAGGIAEAIRRVRQQTGHLVKVQVEVGAIDQLDEAMISEPDALLLDNMSEMDLRRAVDKVHGRATTEASGRITLETARLIAETGVDLISTGWLTHSVSSLDLALDIVSG